MIIACVIGSRADNPGMEAIASEISKRGVETLCHEAGMISNSDAVVMLGDRQEIATTAVMYRGANIPICHIHAGEISGQEPDDTYRDVISRMSKWLFTPHQQAYDNAVRMAEDTGVKVFNCGSPFITSAHNTKLVDVEWPEGDGKKVFIAFNPLPENEKETESIAKAIDNLITSDNDYRIVAISPNTDRYADHVFHRKGGFHRSVKVNESLNHAEYLSYMASADVILGNSSSMLIENCVYGTPAISVGSRQFCRVHPPNVRWCWPKDMYIMLGQALKMDRQPSDTYGTVDSAEMIAEMLIKELGEE